MSGENWLGESEGLPFEFPPVGTVWREDFGHGQHHWSTKKVHILAHVEGMIVFKYWGYRRKCWQYEIKHPHWFRMIYRDGNLKELKK